MNTTTTTTSARASEFPPSPIDKASSHTPSKCPLPAGQTPNAPHVSHFIPSPVECASPTSGNLFHPATPIPTTAAFHNTPASPIPTFAVNEVSSPVLCGPTPAPTPASTPLHPSMVHSPQQAPMEFASETYHSSTFAPTPASTFTTSAPTVTPAPILTPGTHMSSTTDSQGQGHLSTLKGNFTSFVGKMTHNPDKQQAGNAMIATRKEEKAKFFEQQASEWELKGNTVKSQKYREKAIKCRQVAQARLHEPLTAPVNKSAVKADKAARLDLKAQEYERKGDEARAVKCHNKAYQLRQKHGLVQSTGVGNNPPSIAVAPVPAI